MNKQEVAVAAAIFNTKNEVLLVKRSDSDKFMPGFWELPGGGTEYGEDPQDGLKREIVEECGFEIIIQKPLVVSTYLMGKTQRVEITFFANPAVNNVQVRLSKEHTDFVWISINKINKLEISDFMKNVLLQVAKNI